MKLNIQGMSCQHCVAAVREALTDVDGVTQVINVDLSSGVAEIEGNPEPAAVVAAVEAEGYTASVA
ncbi:heavy-metal-associated domain-containing protein [Salinisphaera sp. Q1T1-3]|uniref:heavy-metal-associated domain-containing protein n=1 Tax=Salinisphaera sp. Q1T1-3 TaxID=2321229 RepID=UPI000E74CEB2|nr:cation transporter [Salinisphaera sp. Q1T1-3]RJS93028.1 heavy-metal-associated domain-containing protein [Salinisphaera sp. Q1T1-3]